METGDKGIELIKEFEGLYLKKYKCPAGYWTIGYGHLWHEGDPEEIDEATAEEYLVGDLSDSEWAVNKYVKVPINQYQFDALVSFTMNLGSGALKSSTLLRELNEGSYDEAADQFPRWIYGGGIILPGLVRRRKEERKLFLEVIT